MSESFSGAVFLVGMMGSGKSTLGPMAAKALQWPFWDLDQELERREGRAISEIFAQDGEKFFRELETGLFMTFLDLGRGVVALGGGAVMRPENQDLLRGKSVLWLDADPGLLWERVKDSDRPLVRQGPDRFFELYQTRRSIYERVSQERLDTGQHREEQLVAAMVRFAAQRR